MENVGSKMTMVLSILQRGITELSRVIVNEFLRLLDTVFQGQYPPSLSIDYVAINKVLENCHHSCIR